MVDNSKLFHFCQFIQLRASFHKPKLTSHCKTTSHCNIFKTFLFVFDTEHLGITHYAKFRLLPYLILNICCCDSKEIANINTPQYKHCYCCFPTLSPSKNIYTDSYLFISLKNTNFH